MPKLLRGTFGLGTYVELGLLYKLYMVMLVIFSANSINILAGVNGLEAGQTLIIACAVLCHNLYELGGHAVKIPEGEALLGRAAWLTAPKGLASDSTAATAAVQSGTATCSRHTSCCR